jgi:hypothetical protein
VAQVFPVSPQVIFNTLNNDATFMSYIGSYTFAGGSTLSSLTVLTPGQQLPQLKSQTGLECIIHDTCDVKRKNYIVGGPDIIPYWNVFLIVWPGATGETMTNATKRIMGLFSGASSIQTVNTPDGIGALVQTKVIIPANSPIIS